jgi:hypothetical protein
VRVEDLKKIELGKNPTLKQLPENGFLFARDDSYEEDNEPLRFFIVKKDFWEANGYIDDSLLSKDVDLPDGFHECMEACFEYGGDHPNPAELLHAHGFREVQL